MSKYLELLHFKHDLGLISEEYLEGEESHYNSQLNTSWKDMLDKRSERQLILMEKDKNWFIATELLSKIKDIKKSNNTIKGWITFIGVLIIIGIIANIVLYFL